MKLGVTPSQTVGPFFAIGLQQLARTQLADQHTPGEPVILQGRVLDGDGEPVPDAMVEIWQADSHGKFDVGADSQPRIAGDRFYGWGRALTDEAGRFSFRTIKPGPFRLPGGITQAPHIDVVVFMRGLLRHLVTRVYFPNEPANQNDPVLASVEAERRSSLIAGSVPGSQSVLEWNIFCSGKNETVFFEL